MTKTKLDFKGLAAALLSRSRELLPQWMPDGRFGTSGRHHEFDCSSVHGGKGDSLRINSITGAWSDFATGLKGGDMISYYAAIRGLKQGQAAKELASMISYPLNGNGSMVVVASPKEAPEPAEVVAIPPAGEPPCDCIHKKFGKPVAVWTYLGPERQVLFYIARYDPPASGTRKAFVTWTWTANGWIPRAWPRNRPIYGLELLAERTNDPVMICEGEKACDAAREICGHVYVCVSWPGGASASGKVDWSPLKGRKVVFWPDADAAGIKAMEDIVQMLLQICPEVKWIDVSGKDDGWDAADALAGGMDSEAFFSWGRGQIRTAERPVVVEAKPVAPPEAVAQATQVVAIQQNIQVEEGLLDPVKAADFALWESLGVPTGDNGRPIACSRTARMILEGLPRFKSIVWYDCFLNNWLTRWQPHGGRPLKDARVWEKKDTGAIVQIMQEMGLLRITRDHVKDALEHIAYSNERNEVLEWFDGLKWDGKERIETYFIDCLGVADSAYSRAIGKAFWIGMCRRVIEPGCKLDTMVILEGPQGVYKSTSFKIVGGKWYTETSESVMNKDFYMVMEGKLLVEMSELGSILGKKAERTRVKSILSTMEDRFRRPYGETAIDHKRMGILAGTTNQREWIDDDTGGRRFWPLECGKIELGRVRDDREQLFAEAVEKARRGDTWWEVPDEEAKEEQEKRRIRDPWENIISDYVHGPLANPMITLEEIATQALKIDIGRLDRAHHMRMGSILRHLKWVPFKHRKGFRTVQAWEYQGPVAEQGQQAGSAS